MNVLRLGVEESLGSGARVIVRKITPRMGTPQLRMYNACADMA